MSKIQDHEHGWRWKNERGMVWGRLFNSRYEAMYRYVEIFMNKQARELMGETDCNKKFVVPMNIVRRLWRKRRRSGKIKLVKATAVKYDGWITPKEIKNHDH